MAEVAMNSDTLNVLALAGNTWMIVEGVGSSHGCLDLRLLCQAQVNNFSVVEVTCRSCDVLVGRVRGSVYVCYY